MKTQAQKAAFLLYKKSWYKKNKMKAKSYPSKTRQRYKAECGTVASPGRRATVAWIKEYKRTHPCVKCGFDHPAALQFHHRNPEEKLFNVANAAGKGKSLEVIQAEVAKCDILCANCHMILEYGE